MATSGEYKKKILIHEAIMSITLAHVGLYNWNICIMDFYLQFFLY